MNIRERHRAERWRRWREGVDDEQRETNPRTAGGRAWPSSPIDVFSSGTGRLPVQVHDPEINGSRFTRVHTVTVEATSGQTLPDSGGPVQWQPAEDDPEGPLGFVTFRGATPTAVVTCDMTGLLVIDFGYRWADQGSGDGRFRAPSKLTARRNRQGTLLPKTWSDPSPRPGANWRHLGLLVQGRDTVELSLPHEAGESKELDWARATFTLWETGPTEPAPATVLALAEEDATGEDWLVTIGTADGTVTKVGQWDTTDAQPNNFSGFDIDGASGWSKMTDNVGAHPQVMAQLALADGSQTQVVPSQGASTPDWSNAAAAGTAVGGGLLWTVDASPQVAHRVDMSDGSDDGEQALSLSSGSLSVVYRCLYHDGTLYAVVTLDDNDDYLLGFNPSTGAETSRVGLSAVVTEGAPIGLARDSAGRWWLADESGSAGFLRQFDESTGAEVSSQQYSTGDWFVYGMAFQ